MIRSMVCKGSVFLFVLALTGAFFGCATPRIRADVLVPGRFTEPAQLRSVAVLPFDGPDGAAFGSLLESKLANVIINDKQYFELVDRKSLDKIMEEMKLSMTGMVDSGKAVQVGKMIGAKGIYLGTVNVSTVSDNPYSEKRERCESYAEKKDNRGQTAKECLKTIETVVACTKRTVTFTATPKLVEVETSKIVYSRPLEGAAADSKCRDSGSPLRDVQEMKRAAQEQAAGQFRLDVAPYFTTVMISLMDSNEGIPSKDAGEKLKNGLKFAKGNRLDRGCEIWSEARGAAPKSVSLAYNLGACAEAKGGFQQALALYREADKLLGKPDTLIAAALARLSDSIEKQRKLDRQMSSK